MTWTPCVPLLTIPETTYRGTTLPGGWKAEVPQIEVRRDDPRLRDLVRTFMRKGMTPIKAEEAARTAIITFFEREWKARLMKTVGRWAYIYARQNFGSLEGFAPEVIARAWIPGAYIFTRGNEEMAALFVEMRRGASKV